MRGAHAIVSLASVAVTVVLYAVLASLADDPERVPPPRAIAETAIALVTVPASAPHGGHAHPTGHVEHLVAQAATIQGALAVSLGRVLFGLGVGTALGVVIGVAMGWSEVLGDYLHPLYVLARSVPPLALITYVMLWLGHGEGHRLVPIAYAVTVTVVIPVWQGTRDVAGVWIRAARALGAPGALLLRAVVLPAITPSVLAALRYAVLTAWMTTVGVEMLMGEDGLGHLIAGGGLWSSRTTIGVDPAAVIVAIATVAAAGYLMDGVIRLTGARLTAWARVR